MVGFVYQAKSTYVGAFALKIRNLVEEIKKYQVRSKKKLRIPLKEVVKKELDPLET